MRYCISDVNMEGFFAKMYKKYYHATKVYSILLIQPKFTTFFWFNQSLHLCWFNQSFHLYWFNQSLRLCWFNQIYAVRVDSTKVYGFLLLQPKFMPFCWFNWSVCFSVDSTKIYGSFFSYNKISLVFQYLLSLKKCTR